MNPKSKSGTMLPKRPMDGHGCRSKVAHSCSRSEISEKSLLRLSKPFAKEILYLEFKRSCSVATTRGFRCRCGRPRLLSVREGFLDQCWSWKTPRHRNKSRLLLRLPIEIDRWNVLAIHHHDKSLKALHKS